MSLAADTGRSSIFRVPTGPMCPGEAGKSEPHGMDEVAFRDEFARSSKDKNETMPIRVMYCPTCGHVFSVAARQTR